jgi:hypothetical protein
MDYVTSTEKREAAWSRMEKSLTYLSFHVYWQEKSHNLDRTFFAGHNLDLTCPP